MMLNKRRNTVIFSTIAVLIGLLIFAWIGWRYRPYSFNGLVMQSGESAPSFTLMSTTGEMVSLKDFAGKIVLLYFGYTFCPDVCPTTLADVSQALTMLGEDSQHVQLLFITVDPERDDLAAMQDYVSHFHPNTLGLIPESATDTLSIATQYGIYYEKRDKGSQSGAYLMDHTATLIMVDPNGDIRALYPFGTKPADIAADINYVLSR